MKRWKAILGIVLALVANGIWIPTTHAEDETPPFYIKAVNPGYKIDGISNVGEMIEIARNDKSDVPISLAGLAVGYTTKTSGELSWKYEFPENSFMAGENILLRLASSPWSELAAESYEKTVSMESGIKLLYFGEEIDGVCWMGKTKTMKMDKGDVPCKKKFDSGAPTTLLWNEALNDFEHVVGYEPKYEEKNYYKVEDEDDNSESISQCKGLEFSEILSYYESEKSEQFIELHNTMDYQILLDGCKIKYKNKKYTLTGVVKAGGYFAYQPNGFSLTKNPTNQNEISLVDTNGNIVDTMSYPNGQRKGTAYAWIGYNEKGEKLWKTTYAPTPGEANNYQEFKTCEAGKVINPATGNCVKVTTVTEKVCKEGYYLNPLTGRCNKIVTATEKTCKEGYYLNPLTNRCRKMQNNDGAEYSLEPEEYTETSTFVAIGAVGIVVMLGAGYVVYEFRREIARLFRRVFRRAR